MRFGSVCSGIEAASVAWEPLGWKAAWFSEIEPFPSAVLAHHYPDTPNLGDMTTLPDRITSGEVEAPDLFCGGTPCQAFSVAGLRKSLDDARGNLSLTFCEIANAIDNVRAARGEPASIVFWENVPGVLSTPDNAFGCFLAGLAGEGLPLLPPGGRWTNAGCVLGPQRAVAWRVTDAQYFGVAQRRRRVFVVASARDGFDPAKVLFEFDGLRRDSAPRREAGEDTSSCFDAGSAIRGNCRDVAPTLDATKNRKWGSNQWANNGFAIVEPAIMSSGQANAEVRVDGGAPSLTCLHEAPIVTHFLRGEGFDASEDGTGRGTPLVPMAFQQTADCLTAAYGTKWNGNASATNGSLFAAQPIVGSFKPGQSAAARSVGYEEEIAPSLEAGQGGNNKPAVHIGMAVRRLTPTECERLQGFPDGYTAIPWRKKPADQCPDGPRYKALGNSWAVPNVRWIGRRIDQMCRENQIDITLSTRENLNAQSRAT